MQETEFPTKPFYIQSKINMSNWALTVENGQIKTKPIRGNVNFLWTARKDPRGGKYQLVIYSGKCDVPYTAHMKFQSAVAGSEPVFFDTQGVFTGVNQTESDVALTDVTTGKPVPLLLSRN